ncbi:hypothetical protein TW81_11120 [Vibrio galatheae]|uniref:Uncharacterized protein n=1 Tax=Vibrio galatheae TaxID=579748 RepID=A0A0F4NI18_9VIBR|nr:hypothetical protein [Vibrio galatheae]KJY82767.1 hypothetical protein TW81_11120 [Vibrio galatheae]
MKTTTLASLISIGLLMTSQAVASPSEEIITQYNLAAQGDEAKVEYVYQQLEQQIAQDGADPLSLVYLGSTKTLMGRDAFMPWNKMKYTEQGLATISKGLDLLNTQAIPLDQQALRQGLPESLLAKAIAGSTFTSLPDMFNHFERGYDIFLDLLSDPSFKQQNYDAISWVYIYAIQAALKAEDKPQAQVWVADMQVRNPNHSMTVQAEAMLKSAA